MQAKINVELVYALPDKQYVISLNLTSPITAQQAVQYALNKQLIPNIQIDSLAVWNKFVAPDFKLQNNDRLEILRPLLMTPEEVRQKKIAKAKKSNPNKSGSKN